MDEPTDVQKMVERVEWMSPIHYEILKFFDSHDIWISPRDLGKNIDYDRTYTGRACKTLLDAEILEQDGQTYRLTDRGRAFLAGEVDPDDLPDPTE
jgi:predicted transcriptional regulator